MPRATEIFLDVETDWQNHLTVVGFYSSPTGVIQLVGNEITSSRLRLCLPKRGRLFTYNGHAFDLVQIRNQLGLTSARCTIHGTSDGYVKGIDYVVGRNVLSI